MVKPRPLPRIVAGSKHHLLEWLENPLPVLSGDSGAGVRHTDNHLTAFNPAAQYHPAALCETPRVAEQVDDDLSNAGFIKINNRQVG